jgi:hypothetical protein
MEQFVSRLGDVTLDGGGLAWISMLSADGRHVSIPVDEAQAPVIRAVLLTMRACQTAANKAVEARALAPQRARRRGTAYNRFIGKRLLDMAHDDLTKSEKLKIAVADYRRIKHTPEILQYKPPADPHLAVTPHVDSVNF